MSGDAAIAAQLLVWTSPMFPVGSFTFSHGLEWAIAAGTVCDRAGLEAWLDDLARHGSLWNDLVMIALVWRAATAGDSAEVSRLAELAVALQPSSERHLEATTQGAAFVVAIDAAWANERWSRLVGAIQGDVTLPVALAMASAAHDLPLPATLHAHALGFVSNLTSAAIRLGVIGQTDAQRIIAGLLSTIGASVEHAIDANEDELGTATLFADLASLHHETLTTRLFRS
jgi:urease accessory protein